MYNIANAIWGTAEMEIKTYNVRLENIEGCYILFPKLFPYGHQNMEMG